jgi:hypothetical protein
MATKTAQPLVIRVPQSALLPDNGQWTNRFEIRSESSDRIYRIAQNKSGRHWGCSCPAWCHRRKCKHLDALKLPAFNKPFEAKIEGV